MDLLIAGKMRACQEVSNQAATWLRDNRRLRDLPDTLVPLMSSGGVCSFSTESPAPSYLLDYEAAGVEAVAAAIETGWRAGEAFAQIALATFYVVRGRYGEALSLVEGALATSTETGHRQWQALGHITIGELYLDIACFDLARHHLSRGLALAREIQSFIHTRLAADPLARLMARTGELEQARELLSELLPGQGGMETAVERGCWRARAHLELAAGNPIVALEIVDRIVEAATSGDLIPAPDLAYVRGTALANLGDLEGADRVLAGARADAEAREYLPALWKICAAHADVLNQLGRQESGRRAVEAKAAIVSQLAASIPNDALRHQFTTSAGVTESPERVRFAGLSDREFEVLRLAAGGKTNAEIAEALFISPRTVKGHLESVYAKLNVDSRTAAAAYAIREGWF
jgi:DNA-binding CsgD family transcriptional regulator